MNKYNVDLFLEVSAKSGTNVEKLFVECAKIIYKEFKDLNDNKAKNRPVINVKKLRDDNKAQSIGCNC